MQDAWRNQSDLQILDKYRRYLNPNHADYLERLGLATTIEHAENATLRDRQGRSYIDFVAGYGIFNLGHNPPRVLDAIRRELDSHPLWNRPFLNAPLAELAEKLISKAPEGLQRVFICSTGAEAVESAIKLARLSTGRSEIVATSGSYHGFTLGALSVSGIPAQSFPFRPLLPDVQHVAYGDVEALSTAVSTETAAVILEPIQAEIGAVTPPEGYLQAAREICDHAGALLLVDEVRTGIGRTGPLFAVQDAGITPDVLILGKSLAGGIVPIGAIVARDHTWRRFGLCFSMSASSFSGNRLASVAALETLATLEQEDVLMRGQGIGETLMLGLESLAREHPTIVKSVSGKGLLLGLHMVDSRKATKAIRSAIEAGLVLAAAFCNGRCILVEPPLTIESGQIAQALRILHESCLRAAAEEETRLAVPQEGT